MLDFNLEFRSDIKPSLNDNNLNQKYAEEDMRWT